MVNTMKYIILAQIFALGGLFLNVMSTQQDEKGKILLYNGLANFTSCIQYILLGAYTGCISCIVASGRNIVFGKYKEKIPIYILLLYYVIAIILNIPAYNGLMSLIPLFNILLFGYGIWQKNVKTTKLIIIIVDSAAIIYDAYNLALVNCISSIISCTSAMLGYYRYSKETTNECKKIKKTV